MSSKGAVIEGSLGQNDFGALADATVEAIVARSLLAVRARNVEHLKAHASEYTGKTAASLKISQLIHIGKVLLKVGYGLRLEFHLLPFLRPGARKARKDIREIVKDLAGQAFTSQVRKKKVWAKGREQYMKKLTKQAKARHRAALR